MNPEIKAPDTHTVFARVPAQRRPIRSVYTSCNRWRMSDLGELNDFLAGEPGAGAAGSGAGDGSGRHGGAAHTTSGRPVGADEDFDVEKQQHAPDHAAHTSSVLPQPNYIPQYTMNGGANAFPIQEVVPNSQIILNDDGGVDGSGRPRGQTAVNVGVSANVLNLNDFYNNGGGDANGGGQGAAGGDPGMGGGSGGDGGGGSGGGGGGSDGSPNQEPPKSVPLMVKPKTLYQNPQTPTVLPSTFHPINKWSKLKQSYMKEFLAEFLGTLFMVFFGTATGCQVSFGGKAQQNAYTQALTQLNDSNELSDNALAAMETFTNLVSSQSAGTFDSVALGWAGAVMLGYFGAGGSAISGAHLNPSVTIANFIFRGFPKKKIPAYLTGQLLGAFVGALITFGTYRRVIEENYVDWKNSEAVAGNFCVFPKPYLSTSRQFVAELVSTAALQSAMFALTDPYTSLSTEVFPLMLFILIFTINASLSYQTGAANNTARDLGPRLALYVVGVHRKVLWINHRHFFWVPIVAPTIGSLFGGFVYDVCIYQGHESPVNWPLTIYKEMLLKTWHRRPGWQKRNRGRATSDLSDFSYQNDDDEEEYDEETGEVKKIDGVYAGFGKGRAKTNSKARQAEDDTGHKSVQFKSIQRVKRGFDGVPTIIEEGNESIETASLGDSQTDSIFKSEFSSLRNSYIDDDKTSTYSRNL